MLAIPAFVEAEVVEQCFTMVMLVLPMIKLFKLLTWCFLIWVLNIFAFVPTLHGKILVQNLKSKYFHNLFIS